MVKLTINDGQYELDVPSDVPLLWVIRDHANLKGTKYGCGKGLCGACTVHLNGIAMRSSDALPDESAAFNGVRREPQVTASAA